MIHTPQISRTGVSPSEAYRCHTKDTPFWCGGLTPQGRIESAYSKPRRLEGWVFRRKNGWKLSNYALYFVYFNKKRDISALNGGSLKRIDKFTYLGNTVSSTENYINMRLANAWTAIERISIIWKSDLSDKIKHNFFHAVIVSILLYECTTWTLIA